MKKVPTLFAKNPKNLKLVVPSKPVLDPLLYNVHIFLKLDGQSCAIIDKKLYTRYDAKLIKRKRGRIIKCSLDEVQKTLPEGAVACQKPDLRSGHWPHWMPCNPEDKTHRYIFDGYEKAKEVFGELSDGTYEIVGPKFAGNRHGLDEHLLFPHRHKIIDVTQEFKTFVEKAVNGGKSLFEAIKEYIVNIPYEGIVIWKEGEPKAKIRRSDFDMEIDAYKFPKLSF